MARSHGSGQACGIERRVPRCEECRVFHREWKRHSRRRKGCAVAGSPEHRAKMSVAKSRLISPEHRTKISAALSGRLKLPEPGYAAVHKRLRRADACAICGSGDHLQSALIHGRGTKRDPHHGGWYSTDPADYMTLCAQCHARYDRGSIPAASAVG